MNLDPLIVINISSANIWLSILCLATNVGIHFEVLEVQLFFSDKKKF